MTIRFAALLAACSALLLGAGCSKKEAPATEEKPVDLSQSQEIFGTPVAAPAPQMDPTSVVAVVNGKDITQTDVNKELMAFLGRMRGRVPPERLGQMRGQLEAQSLNAAISKILLKDAMEAEKVEVTAADVEAAIQNFQTNSPAGFSLDDLLQRNNMTLEEFKTQLSGDLRINKLLDQHATDAARPTDEELKAFYDGHPEQFAKPESVTASHILLTTEATDTDEQKAAKKAKAEELRAKLVAGEDFAQLAKDNSDCPSKAQGGNLGEFRRGMMVKPFEDAAFSQEIGAIGPVVETQFGFHVIKVTAHDQAKKIELAEVKDRLSDYLQGQKRQKAAEAYIEELRAKAQVTYPNGAPIPPPAPAGEPAAEPAPGS